MYHACLLERLAGLTEESVEPPVAVDDEWNRVLTIVQPALRREHLDGATVVDKALGEVGEPGREVPEWKVRAIFDHEHAARDRIRFADERHTPSVLSHRGLSGQTRSATGGAPPARGEHDARRHRRRTRCDKSSVSLWVRDVPFTPSKRRYGPQRRPHPAHTAKLRQIEDLNALGAQRIGTLGEQAFLVAGVALYAGEGSKRDGLVSFANTDPRMVVFFCAWLRRFFSVDESRLRVNVYLHEGLDLDAAERHWSELTRIPRAQFRAPYRAIADASIRTTKHEFGCVYVRDSCSTTHRSIMRLIRALLSSQALSGVAQLAEQRAC